MNWLAEPWQTELVARAGIELVLVGILGGTLGAFVVLRGLAFTAEAFAHTVFPGAILAAALGGSILAGGLAVGVAAAIGVAFATRAGAIDDETAIGVVFTGMFALGALLAATLGPLERDVESFLFGSLLGVGWEDLALTGVVGAVIVGTLIVLRRPLVASSFDREAAAGDGVGLVRLDATLLVLVALAVVVAVQSVGNVLVLAMLVTPAATARLVARRLGPTIVVATLLGVLAGIGGLYLSYYAEIAAGGAVVLVATGMFLVAVLTSPRAGPLAAVRRASPARSAG